MDPAIYKLIQAAAAKYDLPVVLLVALCRAESGCDPKAENPRDPSFGLTMVYVPTAGAYGIGDGTKGAANVRAVRAWLMVPENAVELGARILAKYWQDAPNEGRAKMLLALCGYNHGHIPATHDRYWVTWRRNVQRYQDALTWAEHTVEVMEAAAKVPRGLVE